VKCDARAILQLPNNHSSRYHNSQAMTNHYVKVTSTTFTIEEATRLMQEKQQSCVLVVDNEDFLEGIVT
jgi:CBS domain-containing protein